ncbi:MAG TPA: hypothetical protein VF039_02025 [Longimicrobiales bacterium]
MHPGDGSDVSYDVHRLGRLRIGVSGSDAVLPYLRAELASLRADEGEPMLRFDFGAPFPVLDEAVVLSPLRIGRDAYVARHGGLEYHVSGVAPRLHVRIRSLSRYGAERAAPAGLLRAGSRSHLLPSENTAKNFMYNVFDYLTQLSNLAVGQSYIHASSFERDGRGVLLAAWGGVGKTTAMLKLVGEQGWRFLSDDLGLVDEDGTLWRTPKRLQVYAYNVEGQPQLYRTLMGRRSLMDRASWHLRRATDGLQKVRRRVSAEDLFGAERVGTSARLTHVFAMERADVPALMLEPIDTREAVRRATSTVMREVQPMGDLISAMYSGSHHPVLPTHEQFLRDTAASLERAFGELPVRLLRVPLRASPDDLADFLVKTLNDA